MDNLDNIYHQNGDDQSDGFVPATHDHVFKRLAVDCPNFLILFITKILDLPPGSTIIRLKHENTEMVPMDFKFKIYRADVLVRIQIASDNPQLNGSHLVNIEANRSSPAYTINKITSYASRIFGEQVLRGPQEGYSAVKNVYSIVIVKNKLSYFKDLNSYHHTHTYGVKTHPDLDLSMPGVQYTIVELGKLKTPYAELKTLKEKIYDFLQNVDKLKMPRREAESYYENGGPMSDAMFKMAQYSQAAEYKKFVEERERERADRNRAVAEAAAEAIEEAALRAEAIGRGEGRKEGKAEGKAEARMKIAQKLLSQGFEYHKVAEMTDMSLDDIKEISMPHH